MALPVLAILRRFRWAAIITVVVMLADKTFRVCCAVSKRYEGDYQPDWYAFIPTGIVFSAKVRTAISYFLAWIAQKPTPCPIRSWTRTKRASTRRIEVISRTGTLRSPRWRTALAINLSRIGKKLALKPFAFGWSAAVKASQGAAVRTSGPDPI